MDDLASKLSEFLNNPESLEKIKGLSGLLGQNSNKKEKDQAESIDNTQLSPDAMKTVMKIMPLLSNMNKEDNNTKLLLALKPMLKEPRKKKIDESIRILQMMKVMPLLKNQDIFS